MAVDLDGAQPIPASSRARDRDCAGGRRSREQDRHGIGALLSPGQGPDHPGGRAPEEAGRGRPPRRSQPQPAAEAVERNRREEAAPRSPGPRSADASSVFIPTLSPVRTPGGPARSGTAPRHAGVRLRAACRTPSDIARGTAYATDGRGSGRPGLPGFAPLPARGYSAGFASAARKRRRTGPGMAPLRVGSRRTSTGRGRGCRGRMWEGRFRGAPRPGRRRRRFGCAPRASVRPAARAGRARGPPVACDALSGGFSGPGSGHLSSKGHVVLGRRQGR